MAFLAMPSLEVIQPLFSGRRSSLIKAIVARGHEADAFVTTLVGRNHARGNYYNSKPRASNEFADCGNIRNLQLRAHSHCRAYLGVAQSWICAGHPGLRHLLYNSQLLHCRRLQLKMHWVITYRSGGPRQWAATAAPSVRKQTGEAEKAFGERFTEDNRLSLLGAKLPENPAIVRPPSRIL
jgi:hypothetical protein